MSEQITVLILLPTEYNADERGIRIPISNSHFQETAIEIAKIWGGCTIDPNPKLGIWYNTGIIYEDVNLTIEIDNFPLVEKERLMEYCREKLLKRFQQEAILLKFIPKVEAEIVTVRR